MRAPRTRQHQPCKRDQALERAQQHVAELHVAGVALRADVPDNKAVTAAAERTARVLGFEIDGEAFEGAIQDCAGVQRLFAAYRAGTLQEARKLLDPLRALPSRPAVVRAAITLGGEMSNQSGATGAIQVPLPTAGKK